MGDEMLELAVDAAMVEMANIHPPLRRAECERLIRAAIEAIEIRITEQNAELMRVIDEAAERPPNEKLRELLRSRPIWK